MQGPEAYDEESALLVAFANGHPDAARLLVGRLGPRAFGQALRMLSDRSEAQDVTQEALMRLWKIAPDWQHGQARVSTWLYRVVANLCTDRLRRRPVLPLDAGMDLPDSAPAAEERLLQEARARALSAALAQLPERQAQAVALRHLEGLPLGEIAEIMDLGYEAVESLVARGKRGLGALLEEERMALGFADG